MRRRPATETHRLPVTGRPPRGWLTLALPAVVAGDVPRGGCGRLSVWSLLCGALLLLPALEVAADDLPAIPPAVRSTAAPDSPAAGSAAGERPGDSVRPSAGDTIYLEGPDGRAVPVPSGARLDEFLDWLNARQARVRPQQPDFSLTSVALSGEADETRARLQVEIGIRLHQPEKWVRVPLALNEAVFSGSRYEGPGEVSFDGFARDADHRCWLKGSGLHRLRFQLVVPVRSQLNTRRLQLRLPRAAVSTLQLNLPWARDRLSLKVPRGTALQATDSGDDSTQLELAGLGQLLDLQWEPLPQQTRTGAVLQARTRMRLSVSESTVFLRAEQEIQAIQGRFDHALVDLPDGFELLELEGSAYRTHAVEGNTPGRVRVELDAGTAGPVKLRWLLSSRLAEGASRLRLDGFSVQGARRQTGEIAIERSEAFRLIRREREGRFVTRINVSEFVGSGQISTAYSFLRQPFQLVLDVQPVEPVFSVTPDLFLLAEPQSVSLWGVFRLGLSEGDTDSTAPRELVLRWPGREDAGWELEPLELSPYVESVQQDGPDILRLKMSRQANGPFELLVRAERALPADSEVQPLVLPAVQAPLQNRVQLHLLQADSLSASLADTRTNALRELNAVQLAPERMPVATGRNLEAFRRTDYELPAFSGPPALQLRIDRHSREVTVRRELEVVERLGQWILREQFHCDVRWQRLDSVRLRVPVTTLAGAEFQLVRSGQPPVLLQPEAVPSSGSGLQDASRQELLLPLPEPLLGHFSLNVLRVMDHGPSATPREALKSTPLTVLSELSPKETLLTVVSGTVSRLEPDQTAWTPRVTDPDSAPQWAAKEKNLRELQYHLVAAPGHSAQFVVPRQLLEAEVDAMGRVWITATWAMRGAGRSLEVRLPASLEVDAIFRDGQQPVWRSRPEQNGGEVLEVDLPAPVDGAAGNVDRFLTLRCHTRAASPLGWSRLCRFDVPRLTGNVWIETTLCRIVFPGFSQYLLTEPPGLSSAMTWQRRGFWWSRVPRQSYRDPRSWIASGEGAATAGPTASARNTYLFRTPGQPLVLQFRSIYRPLLVLLGAGVAWAAGLILLKFPATRSTLTLLGLTTVLSLVAVWHWSAIVLLLQPAMLGLLLAMVMAGIQELFRRRRTSAILTIPTTGDLRIGPGSRSSFDQSLHAALDSREVTVIRPEPAAIGPDSTTGSWHGLPEAAGGEPVSASESGSKSP